MIQVSSDILSLTGEAVVIAQGERIVFLNAPARELLGSDCEDKELSALLGEDIAREREIGFAASARIKGRHCIVRAASLDDDRRAFFVSRPSGEAVRISEAFISSLRSTLMTMSVSMELCRNRVDAAADADLSLGLAALTKSYYKMTRLLSNVTTAQEILREELVCRPERVDPGLLCSSLAEGASVFLTKPEIKVSVSGTAEVAADPYLIEQLFMNLLSNSVLHGTGCTHIAVSVIDSADSVILSVSDDGCGIAAEKLHSVFERYAHGFDLSDMNTGAGLGLTVARGIAEAHGGTLLLESREGCGTTVRASLRKNSGASVKLRAREAGYSSGVKNILTGLADALPSECFTEKYMD